MQSVAAQSSPETIRQTAAEIVARPYYDLGGLPREDGPPWWLEILRWVLRPFFWLFEALEGLPEFVRWTIVILAVLLCVALIAHIAYTVAAAVRGPTTRGRKGLIVPPTEADPTALERDAAARASAGDYIGAVRMLFRAALRRIELAENKKLRPGLTNRQLLGRYQATPLFAPLERLASTIDLKWYGGAPCEAADLAACQREHARILDYVAHLRRPVGA